MSPQYGELWLTNGWDWFASLRHPSKFQRVSRLSFVTAATSLTGGQPNFAQCLAVLCACALYIHFWRFLPPDGFLQNSLYVQVLHSPILEALLHCTPAAGVSQTLRRGARNFRRGRHLYSAGWPSRCASAHVLVLTIPTFILLYNSMVKSHLDYFSSVWAPYKKEI